MDSRITFRASIAAAATITLACFLSAVMVSRSGAQQTNHEVQFYVLGEKYPKGLSDFQAFGLFRTVESGKVKLQGWAMTDRSNPNESSFDMAAVRQKGRHLTFATKPWKGRTFTFAGTFLRRGDFTPYLNKNIPVIEGTVRKLRKGKQVAEARMRFTCGTGG